MFKKDTWEIRLGKVQQIADSLFVYNSLNDNKQATNVLNNFMRKAEIDKLKAHEIFQIFCECMDKININSSAEILEEVKDAVNQALKGGQLQVLSSVATFLTPLISENVNQEDLLDYIFGPIDQFPWKDGAKHDIQALFAVRVKLLKEITMLKMRTEETEEERSFSTSALQIVNDIADIVIELSMHRQQEKKVVTDVIKALLYIIAVGTLVVACPLAFAAWIDLDTLSAACETNSFDKFLSVLDNVENAADDVKACAGISVVVIVFAVFVGTSFLAELASGKMQERYTPVLRIYADLEEQLSNFAAMPDVKKPNEEIDETIFLN